jgi:hypothetical protein
VGNTNLLCGALLGDFGRGLVSTRSDLLLGTRLSGSCGRGTGVTFVETKALLDLTKANRGNSAVLETELLSDFVPIGLFECQYPVAEVLERRNRQKRRDDAENVSNEKWKAKKNLEAQMDGTGKQKLDFNELIRNVNVEIQNLVRHPVLLPTPLRGDLEVEMTNQGGESYETENPH